MDWLTLVMTAGCFFLAGLIVGAVGVAGIVSANETADKVEKEFAEKSEELKEFRRNVEKARDKMREDGSG
jgi:hypothetical protein